MPKIEEHVETSRQRTGKDYLELHEWMDADPGKKAERHDVKRICEYGQLMKAKYGREGLEEYVQHIYEDITARYLEDQADITGAIQSQVAVADLRAQLAGGEGDACPIPVSDVDLLRRSGMSEEDIAHSIQVAQKAMELAERAGVPLDMVLVGRGGLFHDLGKARSRGDDHGVVGARIGKRLELPGELLEIMEKHVKAGLTEEEALAARLPVKDYSAKTLEEKIVIYADKLVDIVSHPDGIVSSDAEAEAGFPEILASHPRFAKGDKPMARLIRIHEEIQGLMGGKG
ncbi:MAG: HDIG domain-containing protein [Desulfomonile tiedjei]|nr:HDIG domain-containing protein [Desulfomonile tiedjei]